MTTFTDVLMIIGLFTLRIGVPLAVIAALAYGLKRLDRRWEAEARERIGVTQPVEQPVEQPVQRPGVLQPTPQLGIKADVSLQQPFADLARAREPEVADKVKGNGHL